MRQIDLTDQITIKLSHNEIKRSIYIRRLSAVVDYSSKEIIKEFIVTVIALFSNKSDINRLLI